MKRDLRLGVLRGTGRRLTVAATAMALDRPACLHVGHARTSRER